MNAGERLAAEIRQLRKSSQYSQDDLARSLGYSRQYVARAEQHVKGLPSEPLVAALDDVLNAGGALVALREEARAERKARRSRRGGRPRPAPAGAGPDVLDSALDVTARMQWLSAPNVSRTVLDQLDDAVADVIDQFEVIGPRSLVPQLVGQRRWVEDLLHGHQHPRQRDRLYAVAAQLSNLLGCAALDLGAQATARAYCREAYQLAEITERSDLLAWVRGTQSLNEYYAGRYPVALDFARDGQRHAHNSPQSIRLAVNGEARALGKLGDAAGVDEAVGRALDLLDRFPPVADQDGRSLSPGPYTRAQVAGNAATAYLSAGLPARARPHAEYADAAFGRIGLAGPLALTRLDLAVTLLHQPGQPDPEHAAEVALRAVNGAAGQFVSVWQRTGEFLAAASPWATLGSVRDVDRARREIATALVPHPAQRSPALS